MNDAAARSGLRYNLFIGGILCDSMHRLTNELCLHASIRAGNTT